MTTRKLEPPALLTVQQAARLLHVSDDTVRRQIKEGALEAIRVRTTPTGRAQYRIPVKAVQQVLGNTALALDEEPDPFEPLRQAFEPLSDDEREEVIAQAVQWARAHMPVDDRPRSPALTKEEIAQRLSPGAKELMARLRDDA